MFCPTSQQNVRVVLETFKFNWFFRRAFLDQVNISGSQTAVIQEYNLQYHQNRNLWS